MSRFLSFTAAICLTALAVVPNAAWAKDHTIKIISDYENMRMAFEPDVLTIEPGDTVTWVDTANESHNIISYPDGYPEGAEGFHSPFLDKKDQKWSHVFPKAGTYEYHCIPHIMMGMRGKIIVGKPSLDTERHKPSAAERKTYRDALLSFFDEDDFKHMPDYVRERLKKN